MPTSASAPTSAPTRRKVDDGEEPPTIAKGKSSRPSAPAIRTGDTHRLLELRRGLWSLGGQIGFGWHRAPSIGGSGAESADTTESGWTINVLPTLGYFIASTIELTLRPEAIFRFGALYTKPVFVGHQLGVNLGARAYLFAAGRWSLYLGLHGGIGTLLLEENNTLVTYRAELEPGLLFALTASAALRVTASVRVEHTPKAIEYTLGSYLTQTRITWQPTVGLAFFL